MLLSLFLSFAKIGLFTFGGGYAMIPLIERICVTEKNWITSDDLMNMIVIAESTPGPAAINFATYVGYRKKGILGALIATLGITLPSFAILFVISIFLDSFLEIRWVAGAFRGIRVAVGILIADAAFRMFRKMPKKPLTYVIFLLSFAAMFLIDVFSLRFSAVFLMLIAAVIGLVFFLIRNGVSAKGGDGS